MIFLALTLSSFALSAIGKLSDNVGVKIIVFVGFLSFSSFLTLLDAVSHYDTEQVVFLCVMLLLIGTPLYMI